MLRRISFSRPATDIEFAAIMQIASCFNDDEWRGFGRGVLQFNSGDWAPASGVMTGELDVGRSRLLIDQDTRQPTGHALYRETNFAILGDVTLGEPKEICDPPLGGV
jgi:hypothetical protein